MAQSTSQLPTVRNSLRPLWKMTRPENFPGIVLFHLVGVFLAARNLAETSHYRRLILHPGLIMTLLSLVLTSSASMVVNDYYDAKLGRDAYKLHTSAVTGLPLLKGDVPLPVARRFLSSLYGASLLVLALVPGIPTRLSIVMGLMITYFYTQSLKPICWVKNAVCASLIALAPLTSGAAAVHLLRTGRQAFELSLSIVPLWRLVAVLFFGVFGREVMMDCNDSDADRRAGIMTIPVLHGRRYAAQVALLSNTGMALSAISGPMWHLVCGAGSPAASLRRLALASVGSALAIRRGYQVLKTGGAEKAVIEGAVDEGLITVLFFLASFV
jgi:4-hydroxybenzoate polyprenyltransferase